MQAQRWQPDPVRLNVYLECGLLVAINPIRRGTCSDQLPVSQATAQRSSHLLNVSWQRCGKLLLVKSSQKTYIFGCLHIYYSRRVIHIMHRCIRSVHEQKREVREDTYVFFHGRNGFASFRFQYQHPPYVTLWCRTVVSTIFHVHLKEPLPKWVLSGKQAVDLFFKTRIYIKVKICRHDLSQIEFSHWKYPSSYLRSVSCFIGKLSFGPVNVFVTNMLFFWFVKDCLDFNNNCTEQRLY